jgi:hypothetical protein
VGRWRKEFRPYPAGEEPNPESSAIRKLSKGPAESGNITSAAARRCGRPRHFSKQLEFACGAIDFTRLSDSETPHHGAGSNC